MRRNSNLVGRRKGSKNYHTTFTVDGHRIRRSLRTDNREIAEKLAAKIQRDALLGELTGKKPECTLGEAMTKDWNERARHLEGSGPACMKSAARVLVNGRKETKDKETKEGKGDAVTGLGKLTWLSQITDAVVATYVAERRISVANATVNADLRVLRTVLNRARNVWKVATPTITWKLHFLKERKRQRILTPQEEEAFFRELRPDAHGIARYLSEGGVRKSNATGLRWDDVKDGHDDPDDDVIIVRLKGGGILHLPITPAIAAILANERGRHPEWVFTFVAKQNWKKNKTQYIKGQRYPFNNHWFWNLVNRALRKIGLWKGKNSPDNVRLHDFRHTAASRMQEVTGDIKVVQEFLGHKKITTTERYVHLSPNAVRRGMEKMNAHNAGISLGAAASASAPTIALAEPTANGVDPRLSRIAIIDLEASGLGSASFPTEIGWAMFCEDGSIESGSCLIQPTAKWLRYRNAWSAASERLTGITREMLDRDGVPPMEALQRFWHAVEGRELFSDAPEFDLRWFCMLARAAGCDLREDEGGDFFGDLTQLVDEMSLTVAFGDLPRHRAEADARRLLMGLRNQRDGLGRAALVDAVE